MIATGQLDHDVGSEAPCPATANIRMVAVDLDGTLLRSDHTVSAVNARAIEQAVAHGVPVVLASARPPRSVAKLAMTLPIDNSQVHYNGALIHDRDKDKHSFHLPIPPRLARAVVKTARRCNRKVIVSAEILDKWYTDQVDDRYVTETARHFAPDHVGPLRSFLHKAVTKLMFAGPPDMLGAVNAALQHKFADRIQRHVCDTTLIQVAHRDADKSHAVARIADERGVKPEQVLAIGDAPNDTQLLRWAGVGVAVANGWVATRNAADVIAPPNDDDGVAWAIDRYVLGRNN